MSSGDPKPGPSKRTADYSLDFFKIGKKVKSSPVCIAPSNSEPVAIADLAVRTNKEKPTETIEFLVTFKSHLRKTLRDKKDFFSFDCFDGTAEIGCTAYEEAARALHSQIQVLNAYSLQNFSVKPAIPEHNRSTTSQLQLYAEVQTRLCVSEKVFQLMDIEFSPLDEVALTDDQTKLNVVGIVVGEKPLVVTENYQRHEIAIVDDSKQTVWLNLWNDNALMKIELYSSVVVRGAVVGSWIEYDQNTKKTHVLKTLTANSTKTGFWVNPDMKQAWI